MLTSKEYIDSYMEELQKFTGNMNAAEPTESPFLVDFSPHLPEQILEEAHNRRLKEELLSNYDDCINDFAEEYFAEGSDHVSYCLSLREGN